MQTIVCIITSPSSKTSSKKSTKNLTTAELICHGPTSPKVAEEFVHALERKYQSRVVSFNVRYKKDGKWTPPYLKAEFADGREYLEPLYATNYGRAFGIFSRPSCYSCTYKGDKQVADITFGDYWGCTDADAFYNPGGVSVIFVHTERGVALLEGLTDLELTETEFEHAAKGNPLLFNSKTKSPQREVFAEVFAEKGLHDACKRSQTVKQRVLAVVGWWCPGWVMEVGRKVFLRR